MNRVSNSFLHIIAHCTRIDSISYWRQLYKLGPWCFSLVVYQLLQAGYQEYPPFLAQSKANAVQRIHSQRIWKPHSDIMAASHIGENTRELQMVRGHSCGPGFNIFCCHIGFHFLVTMCQVSRDWRSCQDPDSPWGKLAFFPSFDGG